MKNLITLSFILFALVLEAQDIIIKKDGSEISGKVEKITSSDIEYRRSDQSSTGPVYTIAKSEVFMVRYKDGTKDVFNTIASEPTPKNDIQPAPVAAPPAPPVPQVVQQPVQTNEASSYQSREYENVDSRNWYMQQSFLGYGGSFLSPYGASSFTYFPNGWGYYLNVRLQFPIDYHAYTIPDGSGDLIIVDANGSSPLSMEGYELDTDWKLFYKRTTFLVGTSKLLGTDLGRLVIPGIYGGIGLTRQTKYYPYWSNYYSDYIVVKDSENSTLGAELELGGSFIIDKFHFNTGFSFNTSTTQFDWAFGLGYEF